MNSEMTNGDMFQSNVHGVTYHHNTIKLQMMNSKQMNKFMTNTNTNNTNKDSEMSI